MNSAAPFSIAIPNYFCAPWNGQALSLGNIGSSLHNIPVLSIKCVYFEYLLKVSLIVKIMARIQISRVRYVRFFNGATHCSHLLWIVLACAEELLTQMEAILMVKEGEWMKWEF